MRRLFLLPLLLLPACKSAFDPNTRATALAVGELVGAYLFRKGEAWAYEELEDGDQEWKDEVADFYLGLKDFYDFSQKDCQLVEEEVTRSLQELRQVFPQKRKK